ncbi:MAG: STAS domain-containing protein [Vicinamibacterales bacterium]|nr:STAS domain-containing protein [Vicinamibacterales bacterium]
MGGFAIERRGSRSVVVVSGDLTAPMVPSLQGSLKQEIDEGALDIVFDLAATETLDSSGIGLLIAACNSLARISGRISVVNLSPPLLQLLHSMRLVSRLNASPRQA